MRAVMNELLPTSYEQLRRSFDDLRYGGFSKYPLVGFGSLTTFDPSRVPEGGQRCTPGTTCRTPRRMVAPGMRRSATTPSAC